MTSTALADATIARLEQRILRMIRAAGAGHPGGSLSSVGILAEILLSQGRFAPGADDHDWFVLAKGHAAPALYANLVELGYFDDDELDTFKHLGARLQGHPDRRKAPGVQVTTGHLGQGLSIALGLAIAEQLERSDRHVWAVLGEGDLHEGQTWEAAMAAAHYEVSGLTAILDANGLTQHGAVERIMTIEPVAQKFAAFGWDVRELADGHDPEAVADALSGSRAQTRPTLVIARTVKGHHVSFMENDPMWHSREMGEDDYRRAVAEIEERAQSHGE